jgi:hypothetical protein
MMRCLFCQVDSSASQSVGHTISHSLRNRTILKPAVSATRATIISREKSSVRFWNLRSSTRHANCIRTLPVNGVAPLLLAETCFKGSFDTEMAPKIQPARYRSTAPSQQPFDVYLENGARGGELIPTVIQILTRMYGQIPTH